MWPHKVARLLSFLFCAILIRLRGVPCSDRGHEGDITRGISTVIPMLIHAYRRRCAFFSS